MSPTSSDVRHRLVAGAADLIGRRGLRGATVRDLAQHSGTPEGSTYHYFPGGKQQLAAAAVRLIDEQVSQQLSIGCEVGPVQGVKVFAEIARQLMLSTECRGGCPVLAVAVEGPDGDTVTPALVAAAEAYDQWSSVLADSLTRNGVDEPDAKQIAALVVAALEGAIALCRAKGRIEPLNDIADRLESLVGSLVGDQRDNHYQRPVPAVALSRLKPPARPG